MTNHTQTAHTQTAQTQTPHTHSSTSTGLRSALARYRTLYQPSRTKGSRSRIPHPGDILYWVGCVTAVSALLFFATR